MSEYDSVINCDPHDSNSFINTYQQSVAEMFAEVQSNYSVDVYNISIAKYYTFRNNIERKLKNSTRPKHPTSPV